MRSDLLCRVWIGESWLRSQFVCINITLPFLCFKITPSNSIGRKWKWHWHKESSVFLHQNYSSSSQSLSSTPSMQSWNLVFCDLSNNALQCIVTHDSWGFCQKNYLFKRLCGDTKVKVILVTLFLGVKGKVNLLMLPAQGSGSCQEFCSPSPSAPFPCYLPPPCSRWWELSNNYYQKDRAKGSSKKISKFNKGLCDIIEITVKKWPKKALFGRSQITCSTRSLSRLLLLMLSLLPLAWLMTYLNRYEHEYLFRGFLVHKILMCKEKNSPLESAGMSWGLRLTWNQIQVKIHLFLKHSLIE